MGSKLGSGYWTQFGQWKMDPIWAVDTGPNLGSGYWIQIGQWILDPNWAVDNGPNLGSGFRGPKLGSGYWIQFGQWILCCTQCGCFRIFLSFRLNVKSIFENVEVPKLPFWPFLRLRILLICYISSIKM